MGLFNKRPYGHFTYWWKRYTVFAALTLFFFSYSSAQTTLAPGDVAIVGFNTSGGPATDNFAFILLTDVEAGTIIYFTDCGVLSTQCLRFTEGIVSWTAPAGGCLAGTMVQMYTNAVIIEGPGTAAIISGTFSLNVSGDQLIVFQHADAGDLASAPICPDQFLFALTNNNIWQTEATDSHTSTLPDQLNIIPAVSVAIPVEDGVFNNNASFTCSVFTGSAAEILAAIVDPASWLGNETEIVPLPECVFTIGDFFVVYITYNQVQLSWAQLEENIEMIVVFDDVEITEEPALSSYTQGDPFGTNGTVAFVAVFEGDTSVVITGLIEGTTYYFKAFAHNTTDPGTWFLPGKESLPYSITAYVQEPTEPTVALQAATNATIDFSWTNYIGTPQADWWDGGVAIIARETNAVSMTRSKMNALTKSTSDLVVNEVVDAVNGDFVAAIVTGGGTTASAALNPCKTYHFRIFHNDGSAANHDKWSDGVAFGPVSTLCPEIKVEGNNVEIINGDITPVVTDHTEYGEVLTGTTLARTFKIKNTGTGTLTLSGDPTVTNSGDAVFSLTGSLGTTTLGPLAETTFAVTFAPVDACDGVLYSATVSLGSDDSNENPYTFDIQGTCVAGCFTITPESGTPGTVVTITGDGFDDAPLTTVEFDGVSATVTYVSPTEITAIIPLGVSGIIDASSSSIISPNSCNSFEVITASGTCEH